MLPSLFYCQQGKQQKRHIVYKHDLAVCLKKAGCRHKKQASYKSQKWRKHFAVTLPEGFGSMEGSASNTLETARNSPGGPKRSPGITGYEPCIAKQYAAKVHRQHISDYKVHHGHRWEQAANQDIRPQVTVIRKQVPIAAPSYWQKRRRQSMLFKTGASDRLGQAHVLAEPVCIGTI